jgi:hypothetical protein
MVNHEAAFHFDCRERAVLAAVSPWISFRSFRWLLSEILRKSNGMLYRIILGKLPHHFSP